MVRALGRNIGYETDGMVAFKSDANDFAGKQKEAWEFAKRSIDQGMPCYGWELEMPEFYVILGYDDTGYHYSGPLCDPGKGPKPRQELGDTEIGVIEVYCVRPGKPVDDARTVKDALEFALEHARNLPKWTFPNYKAGLAGYDNWIHTLRDGKADGHGMAYNTAVWAECRGLGAEFLREAGRRLNGGVSVLCDEAAEHYDVISQRLHEVADLFPFPPGDEIADGERRRRAAVLLENAREAESVGLRSLERVANAL